jgi:tetratricopeptide (TPR) repeat protein
LPARRRFGAALLLVLACLVAYAFHGGPTGPLGGAFSASFAFDDIHLIVTNDRLERAGGALDGFTGDYYAASARSASGEVRELGYYRPLAVLSTWLDRQLWDRDPAGYHLTNWLLHLGVTLAFWAFLRRALRRDDIPLAAALLFAVHPAHPESVTFISGRVDPLAALFGVLSLLLLTRSWHSEGDRRGRGAYVASLGLFLAALLSKEMAVTFPAAVFLVEGLTAPGDRRCWRRAARRTLPFVGVLVLYAAIRLIALGTLTSGQGAGNVPFEVLWPRVVTVVATYLGLLVWPPFGFHVEPTVSLPSTITPMVLILTVVPLALAALALLPAVRRRVPALSLGILWALAALVPVSQILPVETLVGERYLYIPSLGACLALATAITSVSRGRSLLLWGVVGAITIAYAANTIHRNQYWQDNLVFWEAKTALQPTSSEAWSALGLEYSVRGRTLDAQRAFDRALEINPEHLEVLNNYAVLLLDHGLVNESMTLASRAIRLSPTYAEALNTVANGFHALGRFGEAVGQYKRAVRARPDYRQAWVNLGNTYFTAGVPDSAAHAYANALELRPDPELELQVARCRALAGTTPDGLDYLVERGVVEEGTADYFILQGSLDLLTGHADAGIASFLRATETDPTRVDAWIEVGQAFATSGRPAPARQAFERALALDPDLSMAHNNLGVLAESRGDLDEALTHYQEAAALAPDDSEVLRNLGGLLLETGRTDGALETLNRSVELNPRDPLALYYRGKVFQARGELTPALADFRTASSLNPGFADAHLAAASLHHLNREPDKARTAYELFLRFSAPDDPRRADVQEVLRSIES